MYVFMPPLGQRTLAAQKQRAKTKKQSKIKQKTDQQKRNSEKQKQAASKTSEVKRKATAALAAATQAYKERKPNLPAPKRITLRLRNFTGNNGYMEA
jgi:hypothetical protein